MGTPLTVVNRALACSSTFTPLASPMGRSGAFSRVLASVVSAQRFSDSAGCRPSNTSAMGFSATPLCSSFFLVWSAIGELLRPPQLRLDQHSIIEDAEKQEQGKAEHGGHRLTAVTGLSSAPPCSSRRWRSLRRDVSAALSGPPE